MKAVVLSDTHRILDNARNVLNIFKHDADIVIHLGDLVKDAKKLEREFPCYEFYYVSGNNDWRSSVSFEQKINMDGKNILITHGHRQGVSYGLLNLGLWAKKNKGDAVLFGHIHMPVIDEYNGVKIFSPGSISLPRSTDAPTFGILEISGENIDFSLYLYNENGNVEKMKNFEKNF
jgi:putative phosphoesterase